jgi:hypothetical protein
MSTEMAAAGPQLQGATTAAAGALLAQDAENAGRVAVSSALDQASSAAKDARNGLQALDSHTFKQAPGPPPLPPPPPPGNPLAGWTPQQRWDVANTIARKGLAEHPEDFEGMSKDALARRVYDMMNDPNAMVRGTNRGIGIFRDDTTLFIDANKTDGNYGTIFKPRPAPGSRWTDPFDYFLRSTKDGPPESVAPPRPGLIKSPATPPPGEPAPPPAPRPAVPPVEPHAPKPAPPGEGGEGGEGGMIGGPGTPIGPTFAPPPRYHGPHVLGDPAIDPWDEDHHW